MLLSKSFNIWHFSTLVISTINHEIEVILGIVQVLVLKLTVTRAWSSLYFRVMCLRSIFLKVLQDRHHHKLHP